MKNIQADTDMREKIVGDDKTSDKSID